MSSDARVPSTIIYTDGACSGNPGPGGWAWAVSPEGTPCGSGGEAHSTNQRMEVMAVLEALRSNEGPITIVSDSTYVVNCFRDRWWVRWHANGWRNAKKEPVANTDLWKPLIELYQQRLPEFRWVKGHSGDRMNDLVDRLAVAAAVEVQSSANRPTAGPTADRGPAVSPEPPDSPAQSSLF